MVIVTCLTYNRHDEAVPRRQKMLMFHNKLNGDRNGKEY